MTLKLQYRVFERENGWVVQVREANFAGMLLNQGAFSSEREAREFAEAYVSNVYLRREQADKDEQAEKNAEWEDA